MSNNISFQRLLQYVPPDTFNLANAFLDEIESIRFNSITRHRTITVLPIALLPESKYPKKFLPPQQEFIQHVLSRPVLTSREATPTFIQYASLLVNFVHKNIPLFARAMAVRMDKSDSHYLIYSVIPGLFGFFISHDHTSRAVEFYKAIMKIIPPEMASEVMQPFFTSVVTYRFIESVMYPFIYRFTSDPKIIQQINLKSNLNSLSTSKLQIKSKAKIKSSQSLNDPDGFFSYFKRKTRDSFSSDSSSCSVIISYAKMLCDLIIQSIPLLPVEALELIDMMYQRHWTQQEFNDFFFDHFFSYVSSLYLTASPCLKADSVFKDVLNCLKSSTLLNPKFFHKAYFEGLTRYEIPPLYSMLDLPYLDFALTIADVAVATNAIENICELPPSLQGISYSKFSKDKFFKMFAVRSFIRKSQVSELCLTMSPTQLANETKNKKKKKENSDEKNKNSDEIYNFDDYDFGGYYSNSFYNLELDPTKHPRDVDYNKEKFEMVVFNIKRLEVEDNPEFERIFLQEHFSAENEEKSANDITIDLIERIGPESCNFSSFNSSIQTNDDGNKIEKNENETSFDSTSKEESSNSQAMDNSEKEGNFQNTVYDFMNNSPSNDDLTIGRLAKEMDTEPKKSSRSPTELEVEQLARSRFGSNYMVISKMINENQNVGTITNSNKKAKKKSGNKPGFGNENEDDSIAHDGISNSFKVAAQKKSVLPIDVDSLTAITSKEEEEKDEKLKSSIDSNSKILPDNDYNLKVYLTKRRANLLIDQSHVFENYIKFRLASDQYSSFTSLLGDLESIILAPLAMNLATFSRQLQLTVSDAYHRVEKFFDTNQLKRLIFFIVLSRGPKKCLSNQSIISIVKQCETHTKMAIENLLKKFDISSETNKLNNGESDAFWRAVEALQVMKNDIPVAMQIETLNYVLSTLRNIENSIRMKRLRHQNDQKNSIELCKTLNNILKLNSTEDNKEYSDFDSLVFMALLTSNCEELPARYIIFEHFIEKECSHFTELLGANCEENWKDFNKFLYSFISISEIDNLKNELDMLKKQIESVVPTS